MRSTPLPAGQRCAREDTRLGSLTIDAFDALHPRDSIGRFGEKPRTSPEISLDGLLLVPQPPEPLAPGDLALFHEDGFEPSPVEVLDTDPDFITVKARTPISGRGPAVWTTPARYLSTDQGAQRDRQATARVKELAEAVLDMSTREYRAVAERFNLRRPAYQQAVDAMGRAADEATRLGRYENALLEAERAVQQTSPDGRFGPVQRAVSNALCAEALRDLAFDETFEAMTPRDYQMVVSLAVPRRVGMPIT